MDFKVTSTIILVVAALIFIALERKFPYDNGQKLFRAGQLDVER